MFILFEQVFATGKSDEADRESDEIDHAGSVIIAGHGRFGQIINRILLANGHKTVVLDHRVDLIDNMRRFGVRAFYGDASRPDLLHSAGLEEAKVLVVAIDDRDRALEIVKFAREAHPKLHIIARANDRHHVYDLYTAGATDIVRELFDSSVRAAGYALTALGHHPFDVEKATHAFVLHDRETLKILAALWDPEVSFVDNEAYMEKARERTTLLDQAMEGATTELHDRTERGWTPPPVRVDES
jgi:voltage-gated potassium channel Kch